MHKRKPEITVTYIFISIFFIIFLVFPLIALFHNSLKTDNSYGIANYLSIFGDKEIFTAIINSIKVSIISALIATVLGFILAYSVNYTAILRPVKRMISTMVLVPMLLPTITYGFAIIYSFGKQGLITKLFGRELIQIYGMTGLIIGYLIYTLPSAFLIINNSFGYIDKRFSLVSKLLGDGAFRTFLNTALRPLIGTLGGAFLLCFVQSFTDFGIPASVGGTYPVIATKLYEVMLGSIPDFGKGAVIAIMMLGPAVFGILILNYLDKFNFHYDKISKTELIRNIPRDIVLGTISMGIIFAVLSIFVVIFIVPFVNGYPYDFSFTTSFFKETLFSDTVMKVLKNSCIIALISAFAGTIIAYISAVINVRTTLNRRGKLSLDIISMITNTIPGMVLGLSYLFIFNSTDLKGTFAIIIVSNIVHFFTTPYMMAKNSLSKMNPSWETTAELLGDSWIKTILRVVVPCSISTIIEMAGYYFINSMVTISAVIFLVTARTSTITSKIKEFQHFGSFNEIFVLSLLIFAINFSVKILCDLANKRLSVNNQK